MMFASLQVRMVVCLNPNADDYDESVVRGQKNFCTACTVTVLCFGLWNRLNLLISFNGVSFVSLQHVMKFAEVTQDVVIARPESVR